MILQVAWQQTSNRLHDLFIAQITPYESPQFFCFSQYD